MYKKLNPYYLAFALFLFQFCNSPTSHSDEAISLAACQDWVDSLIYSQQQPIIGDWVEEPCLVHMDTAKFRITLLQRDTMTIGILNEDNESISNRIEEQELLPGVYSISIYIGDLPSIYGVSFMSNSINQTYWIKK